MQPAASWKNSQYIANTPLSPVYPCILQRRILTAMKLTSSIPARMHITIPSARTRYIPGRNSKPEVVYGGREVGFCRFWKTRRFYAIMPACCSEEVDLPVMPRMHQLNISCKSRWYKGVCATIKKAQSEVRTGL